MRRYKEVGNRILVLGCAGSGKSTFARRLHDYADLPLIHLDNVWWRADRTHITEEEFDRKLESFLHSKKWIIDGDYSRTYEVRIRSCDTVIFLDYSEKECMEGITGRIGKARSDIPWTELQLDPELVELVHKYQKENKPVIFSLLEKYPDKKVFVFKTRSQADEWLSSSF